MEAENASQLQYLKTLDSIEAKTQQLQTSLQALYVSSGIENFYKTILDVTNNIAQTFTNMPTIFSLPIPAIISFGSTFYSLASVVTNVFGIILNRLAVHKEQVTTLLTNEANKQIQIEKQASAKRLADLKDANDKEEAEEAEHQATMTELRAGNLTGWMNGRRQGENLEANQQQYGKVKNVNAKSMGLNLLGLGLGLASTGLKSSSNEATQAFGGVLGIGARAASGAAMGSMAGVPGMVAGAVIGGLAGALENLNVILPSTKVQIENLTKAATEANNKLLQQQADTKSLQDAIQKLEELKKARYDSVEAEKAYLEANDALAAKYPELVSSYAETGEAIINLDSATNLLTTSLEQTVKATEDASTANVKLALKRHEEEQDEIDQLKDVRDSDSAGKAAGIINAIIASKDKDISNSFDSGALRQLGMVDSFSFAEAISQGKDLNSSEISKSFSSYIKNYLENNLQELASQKSKISVQVLSPIEKFIYDYIDSQVNQISSIDSRETANNKKLQTAIKANILNDVNSYINLIRQVEDSNPFEGMDEASAIIKNYIGQSFDIDQINTLEEWEKAQGSAQEATQEYYDALVNWYSSIDKETYKNIMSFKGQVSSNTLINMLKASFGKIPEEILKGFSETYKDEFDRIKYLQAVGKIDNSEIKNVLAGINIRVFNQLSDAERHAILDYGKQIESLIASGQITQNQGLENLNKYMAIWNKLRVADIAPEQREAAEGLLRTWDGTREGLEGIITSLEGLKGANAIIQAVKDLIESIPQNLNTAFAQISTSIASEIKTMDDAIKDLSKGVDMAKAIEYANKLDLSLKDFQLDYSTGLFTLNDTQEIVNKQIANIQDQINAAQSLVDKVKNEDTFQSIGGAKPDVNTLRTFSNLDLSKESKELTAFNQLADNIGIGPKELQGLLQRYFNEVTETSQITFTQWVESVFQTDINYLTSIKESAQARGALQLGDIDSFLTQILGGNQEVNSIIKKSLVANGEANITDINNKLKAAGFSDGLPEVIEKLLLQYGVAIKDAFENATKDVYDKAIESITKGAQEIEVTDTNRTLLDDLGFTEEIERGGKKYRKADWSGIKVGSPEYMNAVNKLLADGITEEEKSILKALESAITNSNPAQALDEITSSWQEVGQTAALLFKSAFDLSDTDFNEIFSFDEISKTYTTDLKALREKIRNNDKLSQKQRNEQLAKIDKELRKTSVQSTFSDLVKNANNLSEEIIQSFADSTADSTGQSYQTLATLWKQDDGTYKVDLKRLSVMREALKKAGNDFTAGVLDSVIDEYLNQLSNIRKAQTSGYTNLSDMRAVADQFANGDLGIFDWDNELKAYTLTNKGIMQQAHAAATQLASLDKDSEEYEKAFQLMQADGQALAKNIDFLGLIGAVGSDQFIEESDKFTKAVGYYNSYLTGIGEEIGLSAEKLISLAQKGGLTAVKAAQYIAEKAGKKLEGSDVEAIYRSGANKINTALKQVNLSVGSIIDSTTVELLGIQGQVTDLGSGKYVINSSIDLVEAHQQLLRAMYEDNTYTLSELNALQAKVMAGNEQADLLESMSNISELTYDTLGQIAEQAGYSLYSLYGELTKNNAVKNLGGGKIRITDFDYFADLIGLIDKSSEEYIQVLSKYNDKVISYNRSRAEAVVGELKALSEAKAGDQINVSNIMGQFEENTRKLLETTLSAATGAELKNGILNINDASIAAILGYFRDISKDFEGISERDRAEIEDAFETLLNNITKQIKQGLQGKLSNVGKLDLQNSLSSTYGIELGDSDFAKTADGFEMTEQAAIRVYNTIKQIDAAQGQLVLSELNSSLKESNENYKSMGDIMNHIAQLEKEINNPNVSDERRQKYQEELEVAKEIAQVRATTDDKASFDFMNNKLPGAMENPLTYAENWGKAINILQNGSGNKKGFIDARDWYNIVNEMNNIAGVGGKIKMYGVELDGSLEAASELIQKGYNSLESIDGGKLQVNLSQLGVGFEAGAMDMEGSVTKGIQAMAQSQIDMLDGLISVLETVVAMQEAFDGLKASEDGQLDLGELFEQAFVTDTDGIKKELPGKLQATEEFKTAAQKLIDKFKGFKDLENPLKQIKINGEQLGDLLTNATKGIAFSAEQAQGLSAAMNALYQASLSGNYDLDNIYESVKEVLQQSGLMNGSLSIDIGTTTIYLTGNVVTSIDWESDKVKTAMDNAFGGHKKKQIEKAKAVMEKWNKTPLKVTGKDLQFILETNPNVTIKEEPNGETIYEVDGKPYKTPEEAKKALVLKQAGVKASTVNIGDEISTGTINGKKGEKITVTLTDEGTLFEYKGYTGSTAEEAISNWLDHTDEDYKDMYDEDTRADYRTKKMQDKGFKKAPTFRTPKGYQPNQTDLEKVQKLFANGGTGENGEILGKDINALNIGITTTYDGPLSVDQLKEFAAAAGTEYKPVAMQVAIALGNGTPPTLAELITTGIGNATLNVTVNSGNTPPADGTPPGGTEGETEQTYDITGAVKIIATSLQSVDLSQILKDEGISVNDIIKVAGTIAELILTGTPKIPLEQEYDSKASVNVKATIATLVAALGTASYVLGPLLAQASNNPIINAFLSSLIGLIQDGTVVTAPTGATASNNPDINADIGTLTGNVGAGSKVEVPGNVDAPTGTTITINGVTYTLGPVGAQNQFDTARIIAGALAALGVINGSLTIPQAIQLLYKINPQQDPASAAELAVKKGQIPKDAAAGLGANQGQDGGYSISDPISIKVMYTTLLEKAKEGQLPAGQTKESLITDALSWVNGEYKDGTLTVDQAISILYSATVSKKPDDTSSGSNTGAPADADDQSTILAMLAEYGIQPEMTLTEAIKILYTASPELKKGDSDGAQGQSTEDKIKEQVNIPTEIEGPSVTVNIPVVVKPVGGGEPDVSDDQWNNLFANPTSAQTQFDPADASGNPNSLLNKYNSFLSNGGILSDDTVSKLQNLKGSFAGDYSGIDKLLELNNLNLNSENLKLSEGLSQVLQMPSDNIQGIANAISQLVTSATQLQAIQWGEIATKMAELFSNGGAGEGAGETGTDAASMVSKTLNLNVVTNIDEYAKILLSDTTIEKTVKLNVEGGEGGDGSDGGDGTKNPASQTPAPQTPSGTTETGNLDTTNIQNALSSVQQAFNEVATAANGVQDLADATKDINDDAAKPFKTIADNAGAIGTAADNVSDLVSAIKDIPDKKEINVSVMFSPGNSVDVMLNIKTSTSSDSSDGETKQQKPPKAKGTVKVKSIEAEPSSVKATTRVNFRQSRYQISGSKAKGTIDKAAKTKGGQGGTRKTLMGELGPELVVADNMYYVVGEDGAEYIDLPQDAIVFNHLLTKKLLSTGHTGRGKPITNERNAVAFATGNVPSNGPAMASASAALAALKQIRAMWASMLKASAKDLGSQAGRGGGGGKGKDDTGDKYKQPTNVIRDIQRWYNLERQIAKLEAEITYQQKLQSKYETDRVANGQLIYESQRKQLESLQQQIVRQRELAKLQRSWYDNKRAELAASSYGKIFTYDENGLQQYVGTGKPGSGLGLDILENLTRRDVNGKPIGNAETAKKQLAYLAKQGFDLNELIWNDDGTKVVESISSNLKLKKIKDDETDNDELYAKLMENFWDAVDGWQEELDSLYDGIDKTLADIEDNQKQQNEILQAFVDNEISVENELLKAIEAREKAVIDKLEDQKSALEDSTKKFIDGIKNALDKDKQAAEDNEEQQALEKLQRQLAILQRSGGSASQIRQLQDQIASKQQDMYYNERQEQLDAIQEASDKQIERLDEQINLLNESLEYQKENGLFWNEVREWMLKSDDIVSDFYNQWVVSPSGKSALQQEEDLRNFKESFQEWIGYRDQKETDKIADEEFNAIENDNEFQDSNSQYLKGMTEDEREIARIDARAAAQQAKSQYLKEHEGEADAEEQANREAVKAYHSSLRDSYFNSEKNVQAKKDFEQHYEDWIYNKRLNPDTKDKGAEFVKSTTFANNEAEFKNAMLENYLDNLGSNYDEKTAWGNAINAGEEALLNLGEAQQAEGKKTVGKLTKKSFGYAFKQDEDKSKTKKTKISYPKNAELTFKDARYDNKNNKLLQIADKDGKGLNAWVFASNVSNGSSIFDLLYNGGALTSTENKKGIDELSNEMTNLGGNNGYYDPRRTINLPNITGIPSGQLTGKSAFGASTFRTKNDQMVSPSKKNNTIAITDVKGLKWDSKNKIKTLSGVQVSQVQPSGGQMETLQNPTWIAGKVLKKVKDQLNAQLNDQLIVQLKYLNAYKEGGIIDFTGPAWVDGTKAHPESILSADQTAFLREDLLGNSNTSLKSILATVADSFGGNISTNNNSRTDDSVVIENIDVTFESGVIDSDYDMKRASDMFKDELVRIARKSGNRNVSRR